jgi:hypothetical protein
MDLSEIGRGGMNSTHQVEDRDQWNALVNTEMKLQVPQNVGKFLKSSAAGLSMRREFVSSDIVFF